MRWFPKSKKKNKSDNSLDSFKKEINRAKELEKCRLEAGEEFVAAQRETSRLKEEILKLEKEAVYWKEKALNFRRFHQGKKTENFSSVLAKSVLDLFFI